MKSHTLRTSFFYNKNGLNVSMKRAEVHRSGTSDARRVDGRRTTIWDRTSVDDLTHRAGVVVGQAVACTIQRLAPLLLHC